MKIIFLDIDGVLNSHQYDIHRKPTDGNVDDSRLVLLKHLIDQTSAKVVLTSTWRCHWDPEGVHTDEVGKELEAVLNQFGIMLYDKTQTLNNKRAEEIQAWLDVHTYIRKFVIIDDIKFGWGELDPYVIKTDYRIGRGLESTHIEKAIQILTEAE